MVSRINIPLHDSTDSHTVRGRLIEAVGRLYGIPSDDPALASIAIEMPPRRALGDLAVPLAFELARRLRKAPRAIAQEIAGTLGAIEGIDRVEAAPNGYVNLFIDRRAALTRWLAVDQASPSDPGSKTIVEHTAINPNKAAHIGHLRNAALGDAFGRLLRFLGRTVEIQNYIDDTGVQVADVAVGFRELEGKSLDEVRKIADAGRFDYECWDIYARVTEWYEEDKERLKIRATTLHDIERGQNPTADLAHFIADRIVRCHLRTMKRMNIGYDLLTWEGDILKLHFWSHAFEFLKKTGAVFLQPEGRLKGCWVMRIDEEPGAPGDEATASGANAVRRRPDLRMASRIGAEPGGIEPREKVIVRSDGTVTYVGKDMAYQLWKFGLLGKDFHYRVFDGTAARPPLVDQRRRGGRGRESPRVRRRLLGVQRHRHAAVVSAEAGQAGARRARLRASGLAFGALLLRNGRSLPRDGARARIRPQCRRRSAVRRGVRTEGLGVKADDLLDRLTEKAAGEVVKRNPDLPAEDAAGSRNRSRSLPSATSW